jgi:hypothetical protein
MGRNREVDPRRVFVNDAARNDSLPSAAVGRGLQFVLQPGKSYTLRMKSTVNGDLLDFYARNSGGGYSRVQSVPGTSQAGRLSFAFQATRNTADYYLAFLRAEDGGAATLPDSIRLIPADTAKANTVKVRLLMVRQLHGLPGETAKRLYATAFHTELKSIFSAYGIAVDTSTVIVEPDSLPLTLTFNADTTQIPGTRLAGAINMYLIDNIQSSASTTIVGFAPREAFDLSASPESRVVLNVRGGTAASMAVTAAHEMGHFIGLRHTTATQQDRSFDNDESNRDDGFASTPYCGGLVKRSTGDGFQAQEIILGTPGGRPYCLRVHGTAATCNCADVDNLMYPYKCEPPAQKTLGADQQVFLRHNLKVFQ